MAHARQKDDGAMAEAEPLHIVEPRLTGDTGHCLSLVRALARATGEAGAADRLTIWGGVEAAARWPGPGLLKPHFRRHWRRLQAFRLLHRLLREPGRILVATAGTSDLVMAHWAAAGRIPPNKLFLFVHWVGAKADKAALLARIARRQPDIHILAPTQAVADLFARCGFERTLRVPYPVEAPDAAAPEPLRHLLVAGGARLDKGFDKVVDLVEALRARGSTLPIVVQTSAEEQHLKDAALSNLLARLRGSAHPALRLLPDAMGPADYRALFRGAIVLQPYDAAAFSDRVSGVTLDALAAGAPVVTTAGTWMARLVDDAQAGVATPDLSPRGLLQALDAVLADHTGYAARARQASARLRAEHSARTLIDAVLADS
jgi:glycosyltransferase involved in cell wall biosynthesis